MVSHIQSSFDESLASKGWASTSVAYNSDDDFKEKLYQLALTLGKPISTRLKGDSIDELKPIKRCNAPRNSLSNQYETGEFPMHSDTAHWIEPCRFIILGCTNPGSADRPTLLLNVSNLPLSNQERSDLDSTPFAFKNGRNSFFGKILSKQRQFIRFDPGCMEAKTPCGPKVMSILSRSRWKDYIETFHWESGTILAIDNWCTLHGREKAKINDSDRRLLRISVR